MTRVIATLMVLLVFACTAFASSPAISEWKTSQYIQFLSKERLENKIPNGLQVTFKFPSLMLSDTEFLGSYTQRYGSLFTTRGSVICTGVNIELKNNSTEVLIIKWSESNISIGQYSGMPFLDGMKFKDAGNPAYTPDTILPPNKVLSRSIYTSSVTFAGMNWTIGGEPIPKDNSMQITLTLKVLDASGTAKYFVVTSPTIGIPQDITKTQ